MPDLSSKKLKAIAKIIGIRGYISMSRENFLNKLELVKESEKNFDGARIEKIRKYFSELRYRFSKPKIKEIRKGLYIIEIKKIEEIEKNLLKLEKSLSELETYHDYDGIEFKGIRNEKNYLIYQLMKIIISQ